MLPEQYTKLNIEKCQTCEAASDRKMRFSSSQVALPVYKPENRIGKGSYSIVYAATWLNERKVAVKEVKFKITERYTSYDPYREEKILEAITELKSENIVEYLGSYVGGDSIYFVMAFAGIQLDKFLDPLTGKLEKEHINNIVYQSLNSLTDLQKLKIAHGDFHFFNMCYDKLSDKIKLIDFGLAAIYGDDYDKKRKYDLANLGSGLLCLQLKMKGLNEDELSEKKTDFYRLDREVIISSGDHWCEKLSVNQKEFIIKCLFESNKPEAILQLKNSFSSRLSLAGLSA